MKTITQIKSNATYTNYFTTFYIKYPTFKINYSI